jgi:mono/diheme cytochrome c family protein
MLRHSASLALVTTLSLAALACSKPEDKPAPAPVAAPAPQPAETTQTNAGGGGGGGGAGTAEAKTIFATRCSTCHGVDGKGNGPASITLNPKPRNYTDAGWQNSVTDDHIREIIVKGGAAVGKSPLMPPNPDLENKPEVVTGLVAIVRSFGGK